MRGPSTSRAAGCRCPRAGRAPVSAAPARGAAHAGARAACAAPAPAAAPRAPRARGRAPRALTDSYDGSWSSLSSGEEGGYVPLDARAFMLDRSGFVDFYQLLGVDDDAPADEIKRAYRSTCKECHPDFMGDAGHNICILLNEAYEVLMDPDARAAYDAQLEAALGDEADGYTGQPLSKWVPSVKPRLAKNEDPNETRAVFVDENTCIGCKQCVWAAPATFRIEPEYGRSRAYAQWINNEAELQSAIDSCPVSCIHWTTKDQLPALEYVMQHRTQRVNVGIMMAGQGQVGDVFAATEAFLKERRRKEEEQARRQRRYSPSQEAARREAAQALMREHLGWFAPMFKAALSTMDAAVHGDGSGLQVGRRKRAPGTRWQDRAAATQAEVYFPEDSGAEDYFLVPPERALVPISVAQRARDD